MSINNSEKVNRKILEKYLYFENLGLDWKLEREEHDENILTTKWLTNTKLVGSILCGFVSRSRFPLPTIALWGPPHELKDNTVQDQSGQGRLRDDIRYSFIPCG